VDEMISTVDTAAVPGSWWSDLAHALASWTAIARSTGARALAVRSLRRAVVAAGRSDRPMAEADVLVKAAYVMRDLAQGRTALLLLDRATQAYLKAGDLLGCSKVFVDRAVMFVYLADYRSATESYETALRLLPRDDSRQRFLAISGLAHCYERFGKLQQAFELNGEARALCGETEDLRLAYVVWNQAKLATTIDVTIAEESFRLAMRLLEAHAEPIEVSFCALDLAAHFVHRGETTKLTALADDILAWLPALRGNRHADAILVEFVRHAKWGQVTQSLLIESRRRLQRAAG
ncbi:MAG: hypothetical protein AAGE94_05995, partial [Acidobacteriota bacterium]